MVPPLQTDWYATRVEAGKTAEQWGNEQGHERVRSDMLFLLSVASRRATPFHSIPHLPLYCCCSQGFLGASNLLSLGVSSLILSGISRMP